MNDTNPSKKLVNSLENSQNNNDNRFVDLAITLQMNHTEQVSVRYLIITIINNFFLLFYYYIGEKLFFLSSGISY